MKLKKIKEECVREKNVCDEENERGRIVLQASRQLEWLRNLGAFSIE
jgi:hypothetical protein